MIVVSHALFLLPLLTACITPAGGFGTGGVREEIDLAPENGVIQGCQVQTDGGGIVEITCTPSLDGCSSMDAYWLFTRAAVPDRRYRLLYNQLLNSFAGANLGITPECGRESYGAAMTRLRDSVTAEERDGFLRSLYPIKDSRVWHDGNSDVVYFIFADDFSQPAGRRLLSQAIREHAQECNIIPIQRNDIAELILHPEQEWEATFAALGRLPGEGCGKETPGLQMLAAVGLARLGLQAESDAVLEAGLRRAATGGDQDLVQEFVELRELIRRLPEEEESLRKVLYDWFELSVGD